MTGRLAAMGFGLPTWWAKLYTAGLPAEVRTARRDEIACDVHEQLHDPDEPCAPGSLAFEIAWAVVRGVPHDLIWRTALLSPGSWLWEAVVLMLVMSGCGALAVVSVVHIAQVPIGLAGTAVGAGVGAAVGLWMTLDLRRHRPFDLSPPRPIEPLATALRQGEPQMSRSFRTSAGISAIIAGIIQLAVVASWGAGHTDPWEEPAKLLSSVDDDSIPWAVSTLGTAAVPLFLIPLFVTIAMETSAAARQWSVLALALVAVHSATNAIAWGSMTALIQVADNYAAASAAEQVGLVQQADLIQSLWEVFRMAGGLAFMTAMFVMAGMCFRTQVFPRWMGVVAVGLGLQFAPPIGGEFILVAPVMAIWAFGTGLILVKTDRGAERSGAAPQLPTTAPQGA